MTSSSSQFPKKVHRPGAKELTPPSAETEKCLNTAQRKAIARTSVGLLLSEH